MKQRRSLPETRDLYPAALATAAQNHAERSLRKEGEKIKSWKQPKEHSGCSDRSSFLSNAIGEKAVLVRLRLETTIKRKRESSGKALHTWDDNEELLGEPGASLSRCSQ